MKDILYIIFAVLILVVIFVDTQLEHKRKNVLIENLRDEVFSEQCEKGRLKTNLIDAINLIENYPDIESWERFSSFSADSDIAQTAIIFNNE